MNQMLGYFEKFPKLLKQVSQIDHSEIKSGRLVMKNAQDQFQIMIDPHQTSRLTYLLGLYSEKSIDYPVVTRKLLQHSYWGQYAWDANLWPQVDELLKR